MNKYCRICWNTSGWKYPTGTAKETGNSFVAENGFGHEEWLFNKEWLIDGYRYGFLQPIGRFRTRYLGQTFSVLLYTVTPEKETLLVGKIGNLYVPDNRELSSVFNQFQRQGWLDQMIEDVKNIKGDTSGLINPMPYYIANVRFTPQNVRFFDPMYRVIGEHKILKTKRYQPLDWEETDFPNVSDRPPIITADDPRRAEQERTRAAQEGTTYDPKHIILQNKIYDFLVRQNGHDHVLYEHQFIDIVLNLGGKRIFYEIKTENTVRKCIRNAIGQLLEYSHYPNYSKADKLIIVGDAFPTEDDAIYLKNIRNRYNIPISYRLFNWQTGVLEDEI